MTNILAAVLLSAACAAHSAGAPAYTVTVLPVALGRAVGMNNRGQVLFRGSARSFIWDRGRVTCLQDRGLSGGASAINDRGEVAGESGWIDRFISDVRPPEKHALLWRPGSTTDLGTLTPATSPTVRSWAKGINNAGWVVGTSDGEGGFVCPFLWKGGEMVDLRPAGYRAGTASAVNDCGSVVGSIIKASYAPAHAFLWEDGAARDIGTLGGPEGVATAINERDEVVGYADTQTARTQAFHWRNGTMEMLARPRGFTTTTATGINDAGDIVGTATRYALDKENRRKDESRAVLWRKGSVNVLNTLIPPASGWSLTEAIAISRSGHILVAGSRKGARGWLLLTPLHQGKRIGS